MLQQENHDTILNPPTMSLTLAAPSTFGTLRFDLELFFFFVDLSFLSIGVRDVVVVVVVKEA